MSYIEVKGLSKRFGQVEALKNVHLNLEKDKIYGLLGRNGAGKSTLLSLMTNKIFPNSGEIKINGENIIENDKILSDIYCMTEKMLYPENMRVYEALRWSREFYPNFNSEYATLLSDWFGLNRRQRMKNLSTGYASIFKLIIALASNAPLILLDEPVLGLDANHRDMFYKELIKNYSEKPRTIIISTHLIEEISGIIEDLVIIKNGQILMQENVQALLSRGYTVSGKAELVSQYTEGRQVIGADTLGGLKSAYLLDDKKGNIPDGLTIGEMDLQRLFIHLTNS